LDYFAGFLPLFYPTGLEIQFEGKFVLSYNEGGRLARSLNHYVFLFEGRYVHVNKQKIDCMLTDDEKFDYSLQDLQTIVRRSNISKIKVMEIIISEFCKSADLNIMRSLSLYPGLEHLQPILKVFPQKIIQGPVTAPPSLYYRKPDYLMFACKNKDEFEFWFLAEEGKEEITVNIRYFLIHQKPRLFSKKKLLLSIKQIRYPPMTEKNKRKVQIKIRLLLKKKLKIILKR
jgi:hypothetical protein